MFRRKPAKGKVAARILKVLEDGRWRRSYHIIQEGMMEPHLTQSTIHYMVRKGKLEVHRPPGRRTVYGQAQVFVRRPRTPVPSDFRVRVYRANDG